MARMQGAGAGDGRGSDKDKDKEGSSNKQRSRRNEPAEIRGLREAAKSSPSDSGVDRGDKDRPHIQREGGVRSREDVMIERRMHIYGETREQASRIGADDATRAAANKAWRRGVQRKLDNGTLSDFDRERWISDYGTIKSHAQIRADYETKHFDSLADSAWNRGDYGEWASFKLKSSAASLRSGFESFKAAPLDTLADLTRNPLVAGALSMTGIGAGGIAALQLTDTAADIAQGESDAATALRTAAADMIDSTPVGEGLGLMKNVISTGLRDPSKLPTATAGQLGSMFGGRVTAELASNMMRSNPLMGSALASTGSLLGKVAATRAVGMPQAAQEAAKEVPRSPLVAKSTSASTPKPRRKSSAPLGSPERAIEEQSELSQADALALVRDNQVSQLSQGPLPYYNTLQPYKMA